MYKVELETYHDDPRPWADCDVFGSWEYLTDAVSTAQACLNGMTNPERETWRLLIDDGTESAEYAHGSPAGIVRTQ